MVAARRTTHTLQSGADLHAIVIPVYACVTSRFETSPLVQTPFDMIFAMF